MLDNNEGNNLRFKGLSELLGIVEEFLDGSEASSFADWLHEALEAFENYKKQVNSESGPNYEEAFIYYKISAAIVTERIPVLSDYANYKSGKTERDLSFWKIYNELTSRLVNDKNFTNIKNHLKDPVSNKQNVYDTLNSGSVEPKTLKGLLEKHKSEILVIDVRPRDEFKKNHILSENTICIEPISIRSKYTDSDIENYSVATSPDSEKNLFEKRSDFELLLFYDQDSTILHDSTSLGKIVKIMRQKSFSQPLKRAPVYLVGGIDAWVSNFGLSSFGHNHGTLSQPGKLKSRSYSHSSSNFDMPVARSFHDYLSNPLKADFNTTSPPFFNQTSPKPKRSNSFKLPSLRSSSSSTNVFSKPKVDSKSKMGTQSLGNINGKKDASNNQRLSSPSPIIEGKIINIQDLHCTTGLCNIGNSCYMNAVIQCLLGNTTLLQIFLNGSYKQHVNINSKLGTKGVMAKFFAELAQAIFKENGKVYEPKNFKIAMGSINSAFRNSNQQDCSEFLNFVLDGLHEDLNEAGNRPRLKELTKEDEYFREKMPTRLASVIEWERYLKTDFSAIVSFFQGQYSSQLKCLECGTTSTTYQAFSVLSLPIPEADFTNPEKRLSLDQCLAEFTKLEILDGEDRWHCSKCKKLRKSTKKITITRLPSNLIIHFKRFKTGLNLQKITTFIEYPFDMDLTNYWPKVTTKEEASQLLTFPLRGQTPPFKYSLYGVSGHTGTLSGGHYTSYVWKGSTKKWCYFDDTRIVQNVTKNHVINSNAYVLFYTRVHS